MPRLSNFLQRHSDVTVNFAARPTQFDFEIEPFDAAIHYGSPNWPGAVTHHLMESTRTEAWAEWFEIMGIDNSHPLRGPRFEQFAMIAQAAVCGLGVAFLPKLLIEDELASGRLSLLFAHPIRSENSYYVVVPEAKASSPLTAAFIQWIIREAKLGGGKPVMLKSHKPFKIY